MQFNGTPEEWDALVKKNRETQDISKMETTAVEWLFEQIQNGNITSEKTDCGYFVMINNDCLNKAIAMEKEQIIKAYYEGTDIRYDGEQYYKETYGGKDL